MKVLQITEATNVNMSFLKDVTKMVLDKLPNRFNIDSSKIITLSASEISQLLKKYPQKEQTIYKFEDLEFDFAHYRSNLKVATYGQYSSHNNEITINVAAIANDSETVTLEQLRNARTDNFGLLTVLVHEIRHAMQYSEYDDYYKNPTARSKDYKKRDIEIDAAWHDHLQTYDPKNYKNATSFAQTVMGELQLNRTLTDKQFYHYYKKTLKYYANQEMNQPFKNVKQKRDEFINEKLPQQISDTISKKYKILSDFDLRNLPSYNSNSFLLPLRTILPRLQKILGGEPAANDFQKNMLYLTAALAIPGQTQALKYFKRYMETQHNYTPQQAISSIETGLSGPEGYTPYDFDSIKQYLKREYQI